MLERVAQFLLAEGLAPPDKALWVGVSGGVDSMVLLHVLGQLGHDRHVAHVDHGLRGEASDGDRMLVEQYCHEAGIPFRSRRVDVLGHAAAHGISLQMAARDLRRSWFDELVLEGPSTIALAHHRDDAVETFLMHLMRGMGLYGWGSIAPRSGAIIRPLLCVQRQDIRAHAHEFAIPFREDLSNSDPKYLRNRVRHELVPLMNELRAGTQTVMGRDTVLFRELLSAAERELDRRLMMVTHDPGGAVRMDFTTLLSGAAPRLVLQRLLHGKGYHPDRLEDILQAVRKRSTGAVFEEGGWRVLVDRHALVIHRMREMRDWIISSIAGIPADAPLSITTHGSDDVDLEQGPQVAWFDASALVFPLEVRSWRPGDRMRPVGLMGSKLVSDILIDTKVPRHIKDGTLVLISQGRIAWLCGHRLGEGFQAGSTSGQVLRLALKHTH